MPPGVQENDESPLIPVPFYRPMFASPQLVARSRIQYYRFAYSSRSPGQKAKEEADDATRQKGLPSYRYRARPVASRRGESFIAKLILTHTVRWHVIPVFTARRYASTGPRVLAVVVCLYVCLSHASIVSKLLQ